MCFFLLMQLIRMKKRFLAADYLGDSKNSGTQQSWVFLLKMITLGCFGGTTIFGNIHLVMMIYRFVAIFFGPSMDVCQFEQPEAG